MCEEPAEYDWRFRTFDPSAATFEVVLYPDGRRARGEAVADAWGSPLDVVLPFWRGLRELESRAAEERYRVHWSEPFPHDALARLTERVERARP